MKFIKHIFNQKDFITHGDKKSQANYQNFVNPCLLSHSPEKLVIEVLHVPSLHLLLGEIVIFFWNNFLLFRICFVYKIYIILGVIDKLLKELEAVLSRKWVDEFLIKVNN